MRLALSAEPGGDLIIELDGKPVGLIHWLPDAAQFQGWTVEGWHTGYRDDAPSILADLFGPLAPAVLDRIRTIEEQACALRTFEALAPLRPRPEPTPDAPTEEPPEADTGPQKLPSLPFFGEVPPQ